MARICFTFPVNLTRLRNWKILEKRGINYELPVKLSLGMGSVVFGIFDYDASSRPKQIICISQPWKSFFFVIVDHI